MPVRQHPEDRLDSLLDADDGTALARFCMYDDDGESVAADVQPLPGAALTAVAAQARRDLAGVRLDTPDEGLADALVAGGLALHQATTELRHDLAELPAPPVLPAGWTLAEPGWDADLARACDAAYGPDHPNWRWQSGDNEQMRAIFDAGDPVPPLRSASARVVGPDGRSAGHVLCAGPVPWTDDVCGWILDIAVAPHAQGNGLGRALLTHALRGTREAGLSTLGLSVLDRNPARRLYDNAGFRTHARVFSVLLPPTADSTGTQ
ncbi:GNAT family N-acetyltransferase [Plantactinospora soyae]|uniref:Ribosomal protein S18 acetylase RimI-like enzyme n=1 Tax=Plantactinospora soyae TaxID=1544732 RepID=A0A927R3M9_9ACTN|nr:GNAT family N-acetyltransferase [Plantactinospora soyae]MBE1485669.1 ribosomal protein S18 acetylase RimI-like enzyme [Plantactinospora soyae]